MVTFYVMSLEKSKLPSRAASMTRPFRRIFLGKDNGQSRHFIVVKIGHCILRPTYTSKGLDLHNAS